MESQQSDGAPYRAGRISRRINRAYSQRDRSGAGGDVGNRYGHHPELASGAVGTSRSGAAGFSFLIAASEYRASLGRLPKFQALGSATTRNAGFRPVLTIWPSSATSPFR